MNIILPNCHEVSNLSIKLNKNIQNIHVNGKLQIENIFYGEQSHLLKFNFTTRKFLHLNNLNDNKTQTNNNDNNDIVINENIIKNICKLGLFNF